MLQEGPQVSCHLERKGKTKRQLIDDKKKKGGELVCHGRPLGGREDYIIVLTQSVK